METSPVAKDLRVARKAACLEQPIGFVHVQWQVEQRDQGTAGQFIGNQGGRAETDALPTDHGSDHQTEIGKDRACAGRPMDAREGEPTCPGRSGFVVQKVGANEIDRLLQQTVAVCVLGRTGRPRHGGQKRNCIRSRSRPMTDQEIDTGGLGCPRIERINDVDADIGMVFPKGWAIAVSANG
jgi:hypothetical protein